MDAVDERKRRKSCLGGSWLDGFPRIIWISVGKESCHYKILELIVVAFRGYHP